MAGVTGVSLGEKCIWIQLEFFSSTAIFPLLSSLTACSFVDFIVLNFALSGLSVYKKCFKVTFL